MKQMHSEGLICLRNKLNIEFVVCKIDYFCYEDETFKYIFTPYYDVIDLLGSDLFQGIPGLNLDLRKKEYIRENRLPVFISERVPSPNREDYYELLESVKMTYMDPIQYLTRTKLVYSGDKFYVKEFKEREQVILENSLGKANLFGSIKMILDHIARGDHLCLANEETIGGKVIFDTLLPLYERAYQEQRRKQKIGIEHAKEKFKGRKPIQVDRFEFLEQYERVQRKEISPKSAAEKLGISIDKYYRYKKQLQSQNNAKLQLNPRK